MKIITPRLPHQKFFDILARACHQLSFLAANAPDWRHFAFEFVK